MIKHPNCTTRTRPEPCNDLYCPIHGRIRNMDAGASPFADPDAIATAAAKQAGLTEEEVRAAYAAADELPSRADAEDGKLSRRLRREAAEADARGGTKPFPQTKEEFIDSLGGKLEGGDTTAYQDLKTSEKYGPHWDAESTAEEIDE